jgi:hypothetical protein
VPVEIPDDGRAARVGFEKRAVWIGFLQARAVDARGDFELVALPVINLRDERFPDAAHTEALHRMQRRIPAVEIADDAHLRGVWRPHGEVRARDAIDVTPVGAEFFVCAM